MNARTIGFAVLVHTLSFACFSLLAIAQAKPPGQQHALGIEAAGKTDWREQYAYTLGMQAYIFGFPYVYLPTLRADSGLI